jgi:uncharacterized membrane protein YsdA (DUF1294 family)/cold shock CspA family protein
VTRETGELIDWNNERGFGFIKRPGALGTIYVHIKAIGRSMDRPKVGDQLSYGIVPGKDGRPSAANVDIVGTPPKPKAGAARPGRSWRRNTALRISARISAAAIILGLLATNLILQRLPAWFGLLYLIAGVGSFYFYRLDKKAAGKKRASRTPERKLHLVDITFGIVGGLLAQHVLRHKTYKPGFVTTTALITALHVLTLGLILLGAYAPGSIGDVIRRLLEAT